MKIIDNHQKLPIGDLENANLDNAILKDQAGFLESQLSYYLKEAEQTKTDALKIGEEPVKKYIVDFHLTKEYQLLGAYWQRFAYVEVVDMMGRLYAELGTIKLRI